MMISTILVLLMIVPGLALFYGGLVRAKNMLSVLMQCFVVTCVVMIICVRLRLQPGADRRRRLRRLCRRLLQGCSSPAITVDSMAATFTDGVVIPEYVFIASR